MGNNEYVFANRSQNYAKDDAAPIEGGYLGRFSGKTLEQMQLEDPAVELIPWEEFEQLVEQRMTTDPVEVDEGRYWHLLEVLPPCSWQRRGTSESFYMSEFISGRVTCHVVRIGKRYFTFDAPVMRDHWDRVEKVRTWLETKDGNGN